MNIIRIWVNSHIHAFHVSICGCRKCSMEAIGDALKVASDMFPMDRAGANMLVETTNCFAMFDVTHIKPLREMYAEMGEVAQFIETHTPEEIMTEPGEVVKRCNTGP